MPKRKKRTASAKYAERADSNGPYATCVKAIVEACNDKIRHLEKEELVKATDSANQLKQAADDWARTMLTPESLQWIAIKARTPIDETLQDAATQVADINLGSAIHWPVSALPCTRVGPPATTVDNV